MSVLRQSTAVDILLGPFVDETDGFTAEAGLTINQASVLLSKNGQALTQKSDVTACANDAGAYYNCELDTTDTNTVGTLVVTAHVAGARPVTQEYQVIEENVYDEIYLASATLGTNLDLVLADTAELQTDWVDGGRLDLLIDTLITNVAAILVDTGTTLDTKLDTIDNFLDTEIAAITAEVVTARAEPAQGAFSATATLGQKIDMIAAFARNKVTQTSSQCSVYDDSGAVVNHKAAISDDGTVFTRAEFVSGP